MKKISTAILCTVLTSTMTFAAPETTSISTNESAKPTDEKKFTLEYAENSPIKDVPLKNATLKNVVYYYGNPNGVMDVTTDADQNFTFKFGDGKSTVLSLVAIDGQEKYNARCSGNLLSNDTKMLITCKPTKKA